MNETNNNQNQKPRTSKLAKASIICLGVLFGLILLLFALPILELICELLVGLLSIFLEKPASIDMTGWWPTWFGQSYYLALKYTSFATPILGFVALIHIGLSKGRLRGICLAIPAIVIPIALTLFLIGLQHFKIYAQRSVCVSQLKEIGNSIKLYANDYEDQLPTPESWSDLLVIKCDIDPRTFGGQRELCDTTWGESAYALNKNVVCMKLSKIPNGVVLLFETTFGRTDSARDKKLIDRNFYPAIYDPDGRWDKDTGEYVDVYKDRWNQVVGKEMLTTEFHGDKGCHVLFADGTVKFVKTKDLDTLRWKP